MKIFKIELSILFILFGIAYIVQACSSSSEVNIRIENDSIYDYENIRVGSGNNSQNYGDLSAGSISDYRSYELAYSYAFVELLIDNKTYTIQPIDYVGEEPLKSSNYTYIVSADDSDNKFGRLTMSLREE